MPKNHHATNIRELGILMLKLFPLILTGTFFSTIIFSSIFYYEYGFSNTDLWIVASMAVLTTLTMLVYYSKKEPSKKKMLVLQIIQTLLIFIVIFGTIIAMDWMDIHNIWHVLVLAFLIIFVTGTTWIWIIHKDKKVTEVMNQKLREFQKEDTID